VRPRAGFFLALLAAISILAPAAQADVTVKGVNTHAYPSIQVTVGTSTRLGHPPALTENGLRVPLIRAENLGRAKSVVLAIDRSTSMQGQAFSDAIAAARAFVTAKTPADRIEIIGFGSRAVSLTRFSTATIDVDGALRAMTVDSEDGTALYDGVVAASRDLAAESLPGRVIIVLTDGHDVSSAATLAQATEEARAAGASVYAIAIESRQFSPGQLKELATKTGGTYRGASSSAALGREYAAIASQLRRTWVLEYATTTRPGDVASVRAVADGSVSRAELLQPPTSLGPGSDVPQPSHLLPDVFYDTVLGTQVMAVISFLIVLLGASLALTTVKGARLRRRLAPHLPDNTRIPESKRQRERLAAAEGIFKVTEQTFSQWGLWRRLERLVERSDLPVRTVEVFYLITGAALVAGMVGALTAQSTIVILAAMAVGGGIPLGFVWVKAIRRLKAFENQLPDVLITLAAALKAGHSFKQGLQTIVDEGNPPASKEFHRVLAEARLGRPLGQALADMSERLGSKNFEFVITAVTIQQEVGGSLASLIDMVADTVRQRLQFIRKIKGLTAMGRAGAYTLVALPFFVGTMITIINPTYMDPLYHTSTGNHLIYIGLAAMAFGSLVLKKIVSFKG
jgi:tight adherence protein B